MVNYHSRWPDLLNTFTTIIMVNYHQGGDEQDYYTSRVLQQSNHCIDVIDTMVLMQTINSVYSVEPILFRVKFKKPWFCGYLEEMENSSCLSWGLLGVTAPGTDKLLRITQLTLEDCSRYFKLVYVVPLSEVVCLQCRNNGNTQPKRIYFIWQIFRQHVELGCHI